MRRIIAGLDDRLRREFAAADFHKEVKALLSAASVAIKVNHEYFSNGKLNTQEQKMLQTFSDIYHIGKSSSEKSPSVSTLCSVIGSGFFRPQIELTQELYGAAAHIDDLHVYGGLTPKGYALLDMIANQYSTTNSGKLLTEKTVTLLIAFIGVDPTPAVKFRDNATRKDIEEKLSERKLLTPEYQLK